MNCKIRSKNRKVVYWPPQPIKIIRNIGITLSGSKLEKLSSSIPMSDASKPLIRRPRSKRGCGGCSNDTPHPPSTKGRHHATLSRSSYLWIRPHGHPSDPHPPCQGHGRNRRHIETQGPL